MSIPFNVLFEYSGKTSVFAKRVLALLRDVYDGKRVSDSFSLVNGFLSDYGRRVIDVVSLVSVSLCLLMVLLLGLLVGIRGLLVVLRLRIPSFDYSVSPGCLF